MGINIYRVRDVFPPSRNRPRNRGNYHSSSHDNRSSTSSERNEDHDRSNTVGCIENPHRVTSGDNSQG